jgi:hypothetical protein
MFDDWRNSMRGVPDAIESDIDLILVGHNTYEIKVQLKDREGNTIAATEEISVEIIHSSFDEKKSAGVSKIGQINVVEGRYVCEIKKGEALSLRGEDIFEVRVSTKKLSAEGRAVVLTPLPTIIF